MTETERRERWCEVEIEDGLEGGRGEGRVSDAGKCRRRTGSGSSVGDLQSAPFSVRCESACQDVSVQLYNVRLWWPCDAANGDAAVPACSEVGLSGQVRTAGQVRTVTSVGRLRGPAGCEVGSEPTQRCLLLDVFCCGLLVRPHRGNVFRI